MNNPETQTRRVRRYQKGNRIPKAKDNQHNGQRKMDKRINNDLHL